jgi:RND family efflux transporter MFP subunit
MLKGRIPAAGTAWVILLLAAIPADLAGQEKPVVLTRAAIEGHLERVVRQSATLQPFEKVPIHSKITGYAREVFVDIGDEVKAGQTVVTLEVPEMEIDLIGAKAEMGTAMAMVEKAAANVELKEANHKLTRSLFEKSGRTQFQLDEAAAELKVAGAELELSKARMDETNARLRRIEVLLGYARVVAPFAGTITRRQVDTGALVRGGSSGEATPLVEIQRTDKLRCQIDIPERDVFLVLESFKHKTLRAVVTLDALPGHQLELSPDDLAKLGVRFAGAMYPESHHMLAEIDIPNPGGKLIPGLFGKAALTARGLGEQKTTLVPNTAIQAPRRAEPFVFVVEEKDGKATVEKRPVKLGVSDGSRIEVLGGLKPGETVVVRGAGSLLEGQEVVARSEEAREERS